MMADRNPWIPAERRMDMENKENDNERMSKERFAQKLAEIKQDGDAPMPDKSKEASEQSGSEAMTGGDSNQETGNSTR